GLAAVVRDAYAADGGRHRLRAHASRNCRCGRAVDDCACGPALAQRPAPLGPQPWLRGDWGGSCAGHPGWAYRAAVSALWNTGGARLPGANFLWHGGEHRCIHQPLVDFGASANRGSRFAFDSYNCDAQCSGDFSASGAGRGIPAPGYSRLAARGRSDGCFGHGDLDGGHAAQTLRAIKGNLEGAYVAARDFWLAVPARISGVVVAVVDGERAATDARHGDVHGDSHRGWSTAFRAFRCHRAD